MKIDYYAADPCGNKTILAETYVPEKAYRKTADVLMKAEPDAEQVGFVSFDRPEADVILQMAGGEFCANAAMSAAVLKCRKDGMEEGTERRLKIRVSGLSEPAAVSVKCTDAECYEAEIRLPWPLVEMTTLLRTDGEKILLPAVKMQGIVHLIVETDSASSADSADSTDSTGSAGSADKTGSMDRAGTSGTADPADPVEATERTFTAETKIRTMLPDTDSEGQIREFCRQLKAPALGIMFLDMKKGTMTPLVYVPDADTLYWENSCASGTAAAGAFLSTRSGQRENAVLKQKGGRLKVEASCREKILIVGTTVKIEKLRQLEVPEFEDN